MKKATYYHEGGYVGKMVENTLVDGLDLQKFVLEIVNLSELPSRIEEAQQRGVLTLPALVVENDVFHINQACTLEQIKQTQLDEEPAYPREKDAILFPKGDLDYY